MSTRGRRIEVVGSVVDGDVPATERMARCVDVFGLRPEQVEAAVDYYSAFQEEIDAEIAANSAAAEEAETLWRRRQQLLAG